MRTHKINKQQVQEMYDSGLPVSTIANNLNVTPASIYRKLDLNPARNKFRPKNIDITEAQSLYDSGLSMDKLAEHYAVSKSTIINLNLKTRTLAEANALSSSYRVLTEEGLRSLSNSAKKRGLGGYRPHPNKGKLYNGIWFDSNYEIIVAKSLDENKIQWIRPKAGFIWTDSGRKYYPDFYLSDFDVYLDPKNDYLIQKDKIKIEEAQKRNNIRVLVLSKRQLDWEIIKALIS